MIDICNDKEIKNWLIAISGMGDRDFKQGVLRYWTYVNDDNDKYEYALEYNGYVKKETENDTVSAIEENEDNSLKIEQTKEQKEDINKDAVESAIVLGRIVGKYEIDSKIGQESKEYLIQTSNFEIKSEDIDDELEDEKGYREQLLDLFEDKEIWEVRRNGEIIWTKPKEQKSNKRRLILDDQCLINYTKGGVHSYYTKDGEKYY